jgi:hypothetical protein
MTDDVSYALFEGNPCRLSDGEAWTFVDGVWREIHPAEPSHKAGLMSEATFNKLFSDLPPLPEGAFK